MAPPGATAGARPQKGVFALRPLAENHAHGEVPSSSMNAVAGMLGRCASEQLWMSRSVPPCWEDIVSSYFARTWNVSPATPAKNT